MTLVDRQTLRNRELFVIGTAVTSIAMLLIAILGRPPYSFFFALKFVVAGSLCIGAFDLWKRHKYFVVLGIPFVIFSLIHIFAKMRRSQWEPIDWITVALFLLEILAIVLWQYWWAPRRPPSTT